VFETSILVRFGDIDAAGIAYYPRLVNFLHEAFEDFFTVHVGRPFPDVLKGGLSFPTVKVEVEFVSPVRYGDRLDLKLQVAHLGRSSVVLGYEAAVKGKPVFRARNTLVAVDTRDFRPTPVPDWLRERFLAARGPSS
jgi:4-hydroxybenzoyl-CoA thioesterase